MSNDVSLDINQESNPVQAVAPPKEDNNMLRATDKITALYCRLSVEDTKEKGGKDDPSNSIQHVELHPASRRDLSRGFSAKVIVLCKSIFCNCHIGKRCFFPFSI